MSLSKSLGSARPASWIELLIVACLMWPAALSAQEKPRTVELTESQLDLNARALELINQGDPEQAVKLFESSLSLGESNVTYLNLGRTLSRLGHCSEAAKVYDAVATAPTVPQPTPVEVRATLDRYRGDLATCGTKLVIRCEPESLRVRIDDGEEGPCPSAAVQVDAGPHEIVAIREDGTHKSHPVDAVANETIQMLLIVPIVEPVKPEVTIEPPTSYAPTDPASQPNWVKVAGWALFATGVTLLTTATVVDAFITTPKVNEFKKRPDRKLDERGKIQALQTVGRILFPAGLVLGGGGAAMLIFWPRQSAEMNAAWSVNWRFTF